MTEHMTGPLKVEKYHPENKYYVIRHVSIPDLHSKIERIAGPFDTEADAHLFIFTACNCHADLLEALEAITESIRKGRIISTVSGGTYSQAMKAIRKATE